MRVIGFALKELLPPIIFRIKRKIFQPNRKKKTNATEIESERISSLKRYEYTQTNLLGNDLYLIDNASFFFMKQEIFENEVYKFSSLSEPPFIIDCGANIGLSVIYFKQIYPQAKIIAFEPDEKIFNILKKNMDSFEYNDVTLIKKACWNKETTLSFYSEGADGGRHAQNFDTKQLVTVESTRLSKYIDRKVDFLKIDIEGAEFEVLKEIQDQLNNVDKIFVEYHSFLEGEQFIPEILGILKSAGFRLNISAPGLTSKSPFVKINTYEGMDNQLNIYGFRNSDNS